MSARQPAGQRVSVSWRGRAIDLEVAWVGVADAAAPVVVFLHEGLGSVSAWRGFPHAFCTELGLRGLVYSRYGYGGSAPKPAGEQWAPDFMHQQAHEVLPALLGALGVQRPWLFGHSDGGSIALLYAARFPVAGLVLVAPHLFVEDVSIQSIARARDAYAATDLRKRLARHHADPDSAFRGWCDAWLNPAFRHWNIEAEIATIQAPILAVQGEGDEYGTLEQIHAIQRRLPKTRLLVLPDCGHSPHRDQPAALTREAGRFIRSHLTS